MDSDHAGATRTRLHALVSGRVQGVGYRWFVMRHAHSLRLTGWVRNLPDGRVELEAEGARAQLDALLTVLRRGPRNAIVSSMLETWGPARSDEADFTIR